MRALRAPDGRGDAPAADPLEASVERFSASDVVREARLRTMSQRSASQPANEPEPPPRATDPSMRAARLKALTRRRRPRSEAASDKPLVPLPQEPVGAQAIQEVRAARLAKAPAPAAPMCAWCAAASAALKPCARCRQAWYCGKACQTAHWKDRRGSHKAECVPVGEQRLGSGPQRVRPVLLEECVLCLDPLRGNGGEVGSVCGLAAHWSDAANCPITAMRPSRAVGTYGPIHQPDFHLAPEMVALVPRPRRHRTAGPPNEKIRVARRDPA